MSLQTAPLGQLSGLNLPYSIPTYEKPKSILQQALAAALVNVASSAGKSLGDNLTSRDYATEVDGGPAKGFSRLLGPKVDARENSARENRKYSTSEREAGQMFTHGENESQRTFTSGENTKRQDFDFSRDKSRNEFDVQRDTNNQEAARKLAEQRGNHDVLLAKLNDLTAEGRQNAALKARNEDPSNLAAARNYNAEAALKEQQAARAQQMMQEAMGTKRGQVQGQPQVDPSLLRDRKTQEPQLPSPEFVQQQVDPNAPSSNNPDLAAIEAFMGKGLVPPTAAQNSTVEDTPIMMPQVSVPQEQPYVDPTELLAQLTGASPTPGQPNVPVLEALMQLIQNIQNPKSSGRPQVKKDFYGNPIN